MLQMVPQEPPNFEWKVLRLQMESVEILKHKAIKCSNFSVPVLAFSLIGFG